MRSADRLHGVPNAAFLTPRLAGAAAWAALMAAAMATAAPPVVNTEPLAPEQQRAQFELPAGFAIELVAAEPQIQKPMNMAFDARGRLWVTHSVEYPFAAAAGTKPRDGLTILEDFGPDGRARKATLFADELNIPIGVLPLPVAPGGKTAAIVWSIPNIWKVTDTDGDGKADLREVLYGPFDFADTHGNQNAFRLGADGWVYANHGFRNQSRVKLRGLGEVVLQLSSGNTYRFRPDGSAIEHVTWGQVNPFGMSFDALGNRFNADCHSKPLTMLLPGGRYQAQFTLPNPDYVDGLGRAPETTADAHGSTGIGAVAIAETDRFPDAYRGDAFVGNVVNCRVHRDRIAWRGSSPWVQKPDDFLTCEDLWFRPVDLQLGPDGALYVADFYNCIIGHYEVDLKHPRRDRHRGRIWRVVWKGEPGAAPTGPAPIVDLTTLATPALAERLGDPNETVRRLAMEQLVERGRTDATVMVTLKQRSDSEHRRARALRALALLDSLDPAAIAAAAADESRLVRVHLVKAVEALSDWDEPRAVIVRARLADADPFVRRAAAEALAAHPAIESVEPLLRCWAEASTEDVQLVHAVRIALRKQLVTATPEQLAGLVAKGEDAPRLAEILVTVPGDVAAWRAFELVRAAGAPVAAWSNALVAVAAHCSDARRDDAARAARTACGDDLRLQEDVLRPLLQRRLLTAGGEFGRWAAAYAAAVLADGATPAPSDDTLRIAVSAVKSVGMSSAFEAVMRIARDAKRPPDLIESAAAAAVAADRDRARALALPVMGEVSEPFPVRLAFARVLGNEDSPDVRAAIGRGLKSSTASQQKDLAMVLLSRKEGAGLLLELIGAGKASAVLLQDGQVLEQLKKAGIDGLDERVKTLTAGMPAADRRIQQAIGKVAGQFHKAGGTAETGAELFTKHCAACHRFADRGGLVGPQLEGIGQRGAERLLEDILDPNRNVDEAFRTTTVALADGRVVSGLRLREEAADVVFADATGKEVRVPKVEIEETNTSRVSPMPANMLDQVGEGNLPHLLAYLMRQQAPAAP